MPWPGPEPEWEENCTCKDCLYQRELFGYIYVDGKWVKK